CSNRRASGTPAWTCCTWTGSAAARRRCSGASSKRWIPRGSCLRDAMSENDLHMNLDRLLAPWPPALVFAGVWERRTLHLQRGEAGYYDELLPAADIAGQLLGSRNLALPSFKMYKGKEELGPQHFSDKLTHGDWPASVVSPEKLLLAFRQGYS